MELHGMPQSREHRWMSTWIEKNSGWWLTPLKSTADVAARESPAWVREALALNQYGQDARTEDQAAASPACAG